MGTFRVEVQCVGGHGCCREIKDGGTVAGCGHESCVDCITREFVSKLKKAGAYFYPNPDPNHDGYARITHWPGDKSTVIDDLLTGIRKGNF